MAATQDLVFAKYLRYNTKNALFEYVEKHAAEHPSETAIIEFPQDTKLTWKQLNQSVNAFAIKLLNYGIVKGDIVATLLPLIKEHVFIYLACQKIGAVFCPLDLRLKAQEIINCFQKARPKIMFFLGKTPVVDFRAVIQEVMSVSPLVQTWVQVINPADLLSDPTLLTPGAISIGQFAARIKACYLWDACMSLTPEWMQRITMRSGRGPQTRAALNVIQTHVMDHDNVCALIFTTGSTGAPKAAMLSNENIVSQCLLLNHGVSLSSAPLGSERVLCHLPPSHVGGLTEILSTALLAGHVSVLLPVFHPEQTLQAIERHRVTLLGQLPPMFHLQWRLPNFAQYDLSSLRVCLFGGQCVTQEFVRKVSALCPSFGTGLGLSEMAGFCTLTPRTTDPDQVANTLGFDFPMLSPLTIRAEMQGDGRAGVVLPHGTIGHICFEGPQVFKGYCKDEQATRETLSTDGVLYTGDMGSYDSARGLAMHGRRKFIIKSKGYQVFPPEVEELLHEGMGKRVETVACVGLTHQVFGEALMCFVKPAVDATVTAEELYEIAKQMASYKRPVHVEILPASEALPLTRVAKVDYLQLKARGTRIADELRKAGKWDAPAPTPTPTDQEGEPTNE